MKEEVMDVEVETPEVEMEDDESLLPNENFNLKLLVVTNDLQMKHGIRHNDYQRYRGYCARRIARVRKALKFVQGERKKFTKKEVTLEVLKDAKFLLIPLMTAERAWAYAMQLKFELNTEPRKKFHMVNRLRIAAKVAEALERLVMASERCDARTKLEAQAYHLWLVGTLGFETQQWKAAAVAFSKAKTIYERLSASMSEDEAAIYKQRLAEIAPSLRFCAYNLGSAGVEDVAASAGAGAGQDLVGMLLAQAKDDQAATLQEVEWRGRKMAVRQEKVRQFLLREQGFSSEIEGVESSDNLEAKIEVYDSLLMDCKDAIQVLREELLEDPSFRNRQQVREGAVTSMHFLYTYLTYMKCNKTIERDLTRVEYMRRCLEGEASSDKTSDADSARKKQVKPLDLVRIYENIIENLSELPQLAGLEEDDNFKQEIEAKTTFFKAWSCNFNAQTYLAAKKWSEAMALFQRATAYANKAKSAKSLEASLRSQIGGLLSSVESKQFMAHANSILDAEGANEATTAEMDRLKLDTVDKSVPLIQRLDAYYQDSDLVKGKPNLASFPPSFEPIPNKPLFFDLAREQISFPKLDSKLSSGGGAGGQQQGGGGWLGGWLGGWGGGKK